MGAATASVWTVVAGETVVHTLSEAEAIVERRRLLASDSGVSPVIYSPGTYKGKP